MSKRSRISALEQQLEEDIIFEDVTGMYGFPYDFSEVTLAGKVNAIIEHLGIDIRVVRKKCTPAHVEVVKTKKGKK